MTANDHAAAPVREGLTSVELTWIERRIEHWIRFGQVVDEQIIDRRRRVLSFAPGSIFAFVRWASNDYGTVVSRIDIMCAHTSGRPYQTVPFVRPGGEILLRQSSWPKVERVLQAIDQIEAERIAPEDAVPDYWQHVHNRLLTNQPPRAYSRAQHQAWLLRRGVAE